jgi:arylsulfatase
LVEGGDPVPSAELGEDFYFTDDIGRSSASFIRRHAAEDAPFFLFASFTAPHWPLHASPSRIARYRERYTADISAIRAARLARLKEAGLVENSHQLPALPDEAPEHPDAWWAERMATYAAQVEALDASIGDICAALTESGVEDDTLVVFLSDNGGCGEELSPNITLPASACPRTTPDGREVILGNIPGLFPGPVDTFQSYGAVWGAVSNTPFRKWKRWVHEGGIASPLIASWPAGGISADSRVIAQPGHIIDIVPTVLEAVGRKPQTEGESLLPWWRDHLVSASERALYWEHTGNAAIRHGRWKLVREWPGEWELYDIESDRAESRDLSAEYPDVVQDLSRRHQEWAIEHDVVPWESIVSDFVSRGLSADRAANS